MLPRATEIHKAIGRELDRHQKVLEIDRSISKIQFTVVFDHRTGAPIKTIYMPQHESRLTEENELSR